MDRKTSLARKLTVKHALALIILVLSFVEPLAAGPIEDAYAARVRGDYATALGLVRPLADGRRQVLPRQFRPVQ